MIDLTHVTFSGVQPMLESGARSESPSRFRPPPTRPTPPETEHPVASWIIAQAGLDPKVYQPRAPRRLAACLRRLKVSSEADARQLLTAAPGLLPTALDALLIGATSFNRDPAVFARLEHVLLPQLLTAHTGLRVLSAGSSTGEELYSIAILLDRLGALEDSDLLGIDCRLSAIETAASGTYDPDDLDGLPASVRETYFPLRGGRHTAIARLRARIRWRCEDVFALKPETMPHQLILFRNVAIYLLPDAALRVWENLHAQLDVGGVLVTGKGEQPPAFLRLQRIGPSLYRRT